MIDDPSQRSEGNPSMSMKNPVVIGLAAAVTMILAGCAAVSAPEEPPPATVQAIAGSPVQQVQLTAQAMHRLGITTRPIRAQTVTLAGRSGSHKVIPYSAVVYDTDGSTWTFVNIAARTFVRKRITVDAIKGSRAVLAKGPAVDTAVVTVGAAELLGTEYNISGEE
jgi:hypothetical protein